MNGFLGALIIVPVVALLLVSGLAVVVLIVMFAVGGVDGVLVAIRHEADRLEHPRGTHHGTPAIHHM